MAVLLTSVDLATTGFVALLWYDGARKPILEDADE
jgi:hypothetical protein